jgi:tetratricopeptide (TPR) repeat protein
MKDFFISYHKSDRPWAEWIAWTLEEAGYVVVMQAWDFRPGSNFVLEMRQASSEARRTIAALSPDYLASLYLQPEWAAAFVTDQKGENLTLLPVRVRECNPEEALGSITYVDLVGLDEVEAKTALLEGSRAERAKLAETPSFPGLRLRTTVSIARFPGSLPATWNVPIARNPFFTGREDLLSELYRAFRSGQSIALAQAIRGLGGVGKTQLAVEYAYRYGPDYDIVWWVRAGEPVTLASDYASLAVKLDLPEKLAANHGVVIDAVKEWLRKNGDWLLIFDNASDPDAVRNLIPRGSSGHVLITSRYATWAGIAKPISIDVISSEEATNYLLRRTGQDDQAAARSITEVLGGLPLAIEQAAAYIETTGTSLNHYLGLLRSGTREILQRGRPSTEYLDTVATTWELSFRQLETESPTAVDILKLCAFLAPDDIPGEVLRTGAGYLPDKLAEVATDPLELDHNSAELRHYSLAEVNQGKLSFHRLVQAIIRERMSDEERLVWSASAVNVINNSFPCDIHDISRWPTCEALFLHALTSTEFAMQFDVSRESTLSLLNRVGVYLISRASFGEAKVFLNKAFGVSDKLAGHEASKIEAYNALGETLLQTGDFNAAESLFRRGLALGERALGPLHAAVARCASNLGRVMYIRANFTEAQTYFEKALDLNTAAYGPAHPIVGRDTRRLSKVWGEKGDFTRALSYVEQALAIAETNYGLNHPDVSRALYHLGRINLSEGHPVVARMHFERALAIDELVYGHNHPTVAKDLNGLGAALIELGNLADAQAYVSQALEIDKCIFGPDHPNVAEDLATYGKAAWALGDLVEARNQFEQALSIIEQTLGENHPKVAKVLFNLGRVYNELGSQTDAQTALEKSLGIFKKHFEETHHYVRPVIEALSVLLGSTEQEQTNPKPAKQTNATGEVRMAGELNIFTSLPNTSAATPVADNRRKLVREVFRDVGPPNYTYVKPKCYSAVKESIQAAGKHLLIQGPSQTGKTSLVLKALDEMGWAANRDFQLIICRPGTKYEKQVEAAIDKALSGDSSAARLTIIDDFHFLPQDLKERVAHSLKILSDHSFINSRAPKFALVGIPGSGQYLLQAATDLVPRVGIYNLGLVDEAEILKLVRQGEEALNIKFDLVEDIVAEAAGSFLLCQSLCSYICRENGVTETSPNNKLLRVEMPAVRHDLYYSLADAFMRIAVTFSKGLRWSGGGHKTYLMTLLALRQFQRPVVTMDAVLAKLPVNCQAGLQAVRQRIPKVICTEGRQDISNYILYDESSDSFLLEDLRFSYFLRHLDERELFDKLGIESDHIKTCCRYPYEIGFSFAAESRPIVEEANSLLQAKDVLTWYDFDQQAILLGSDIEEIGQRIYSDSCRFYLVFLEPSYREKIWTKFEKDVLTKGHRKNHIIPVVLDRAEVGKQVGLPSTIGHIDLSSIWSKFQNAGALSESDKQSIQSRLVSPILDKLNSHDVAYKEL